MGRPCWSGWQDSNLRPHRPERCALPPALHPDAGKKPPAQTQAEAFRFYQNPNPLFIETPPPCPGTPDPESPYTFPFSLAPLNLIPTPSAPAQPLTPAPPLPFAAHAPHFPKPFPLAGFLKTLHPLFHEFVRPYPAPARHTETHRPGPPVRDVRIPIHHT